MATVSTPKMTAEEFYDWANRPENADKMFELDRGEVVEMPPPGELHGTICAWVASLLWQFAVRRGRGRVTSNDTGLVVNRDPDTVRGVDVMFFDASAPLSGVEAGYPRSIPAVAVEVLSPTDRWGQVQLRVKQYLAFGVPLVWVIDPMDFTVTVFRPGEMQRVLEESDELTGNGVLPDFTCRVADLFALPGQSPPASP